MELVAKNHPNLVFSCEEGFVVIDVLLFFSLEPSEEDIIGIAIFNDASIRLCNRMTVNNNSFSNVQPVLRSSPIGEAVVKEITKILFKGEL